MKTSAITAEWRIGTLRDVLGEKGYIRGPFGSALRRPELKSAGIPVYEQQHAITGTREFRFYIDEQKYQALKRFTVQPDDLIVSCSGTLARVSMVRPEDPVGIISQALLILRPDKTVVWPKYLYYFMSSKRGYDSLVGVSTGSVQVNIASRAIIEKTELPIPPLREQQAIACILGALDDKIELNRRRNRTLEAMARAIFQSWFVDFDPVKAKAAGKKPPGLKPELAALFPDCFEDSPLGDIPEGWRVGTLGEVADNPRRGIGANEVEAGTPYIALEHMPRRCIALGDWTTADAIESNKFEFHQGEILFGKLRPYFHKVGIAPVDGVCSTDILVIVPKKPEWFGFCAGHFSSDAIIHHADRASTGTKMPRTNWNDLARFEVVIPQREVAAAFTNQFKPMIDRIHQGLTESRTLAALRDTLLPKLISGELRVPDAERIVERAV
jgi:type I restriction enzyme S subunit